MDRNVVERSFNLTKQWRGLAARYDKLAITYRAAAVLHAPGLYPLASAIGRHALAVERLFAIADALDITADRLPAGID